MIISFPWEEIKGFIYDEIDYCIDNGYFLANLRFFCDEPMKDGLQKIMQRCFDFEILRVDDTPVAQ